MEVTWESEDDMSQFKDMEIRQYIEAAASGSATPGGGSVSALVGALGAALGQMVYNLTVNKKSYQEHPEKTKAAVQADYRAIVQLQEELIDLIDRDVAAFDGFMEALALPKGTDEEKAKRSEAIQAATVVATQTPLDTAAKTLELLQHLGSITRYGHNNCISDAGVAALCAHAALQAAVMNVRINLGGLKDEAFKQQAASSCEAYLAESEALTQEIVDHVFARIS
jgi:formiminotetrahydrofolate cyclodeaminase